MNQPFEILKHLVQSSQTDKRLTDTGLVSRAETTEERELLRRIGDTPTIAPVPVLRQLLLDHQRLLAEDQVARLLERRQHAEQVARTEDPLQESDDRLPDPVRVGDVERAIIEIDDKDPVRRIRGELEGVPLGVRIAALSCGRVLVVADELEVFYLLRNTIFEDFEVLCRQSLDNLSIFRRIGIDAHEIGAAAKCRALRILLRRERLPEHREQQHDRSHTRTPGSELYAAPIRHSSSSVSANSSYSS